MRRRSSALLAIAALTSACAAPEQSHSRQSVEEGMKIRIVAADRTLTAVLEDSAAGRDFAALLPLELTLRDYHRTEKVADLPTRLSIANAPEGVEPKAGDIAYYAPWGNLAIFYRDFGYSRGLVRLGRLESDSHFLAGDATIPVRIERIAAESE